MKLKIVFIFVTIYILSFRVPIYAEDIPVPPPDIIPLTEVPDNSAPVWEETFFIRNGDFILWQGSVPLPDNGTVEINDINGISHSVSARSVLAILKTIDETNDSFSISNLQFYDSFSSFYIKCILPAGGTEACDNWQYAVGNTIPSVSIDAIVLSGGENIYVFFGPQYRVVLDSGKITTADTLIVTAEEYNYEDNSWETRTEVTVGLTQSNPDDPWSPIEILTSAVDEDGQANFSSIPEGTYNVGIKEDFYFPTEALIVTTFFIPNPMPESSSGSSGRSKRSESVLGATTETKFDLKKAFEFIISQQKENGSFGEDIFTDWVAITYGAMGVTNDSHDALLNYFNSHNSASLLLTDNERHVMALLSLGQNPYSFNGTNYTNLITNSFDGIQFGDPGLINDDIFALIPLANTGYTVNDDIIIKDIAFIISKQKINGSWEESIDLTAAAIQALKPFESVAGVSNSLSSAGIYLGGEQNEDGSWGSVYSTSWAMQAMNVLNESWSKNENTPLDYLGKQQAGDGAVLSSSETLQNRIWATSYAIPAVLGKPWNLIMHTVAKPVQQNTKIIMNIENINQVVKTRSENTPEDVSNKNSKDITTEVGINTNPAPQIFLASTGQSKDNIPLPIIIGRAIIFIGIVLLRFLKFIV
ncbi:hypothetical protein A3C67_02500 [Candidatus Nomurabacteria bacterium RIFCSPHIGHO2_02_FULL_42_19]|uniref:Squalene cyclase C-terminal domain-containing protein n=1 Tax=Candidatus Nomurabacteria bacterium RIFCSPHIGHO2_02_FULL_42_19 TaxID=1801756 RepID=A0A1F6W150_9BACT|nr:MAG: hypothetical protein A3C67_02500 [Candidatus Nomurabacteria bacterium RIFCSPHIGHO2_02_FULL_42_19]